MVPDPRRGDALRRSLPTLTQDAFINTPLAERRYQEGPGLVKIVRTGPQPFLIERLLADIAEEDYGLRPCGRPMVLHPDSDTALEVALWLYERGMLPLAGEPFNIPSSVQFAVQYGVDGLIVETSLADSFLAELSRHYAVGRIRQTVLLGISSPSAVGISESRFAVPPVRVLYLPETGPFAESCPEALLHSQTVFHPDANSVVDIADRVMLTKTILLPTPIIRYDTGIAAARISSVCACGKPSFILGTPSRPT